MRDGELRRSLASTLLYTTTTQNVAWPITMVQKLNGMFSRPMADRSEIPVMIPGSAIGKVTRNDTVSRPKNLLRCTAAAARGPKTSALAVVGAGAATDNVRG